MSFDGGGGDPSRSDAFRLSPRLAALTVPALVVPGAAAVGLAAYDVGGIRDRPGGAWVVPAGIFILVSALAVAAIAWRRPVLLVVGPRGLDLPATLDRPVPWESIRRIRYLSGGPWALGRPRMLKIELVDGTRLRFKRRFWIFPGIDSRIARRYGLNAPLQYLDADEDTVIASVERFCPVEGVVP